MSWPMVALGEVAEIVDRFNAKKRCWDYWGGATIGPRPSISVNSS